MGNEADQGKKSSYEITAPEPENLCEEMPADQELDAYKDLMLQLRTINLLIQKQCQAPIAEIVSLLAIQKLCKGGGEISESVIGEKMHLSRPAISRMIHTLKRKGYIEYHPGSKDHRYLYIVLTKAGQQLINEEMGRYMSLIKKVSEMMGQEDMDNFLYYSGKFFSLLALAYFK